MKIGAFFAEHNIAFNNAEHLEDLLKDCFPDSNILKETFFKRKKLTGIVVGKSQKKILAVKLKTSKFSVLADESTDISFTKPMCVVVRYFDKDSEKLESKFSDLHQIYRKENEQLDKGATAASLYQGLNDSFAQEGVPNSSIVGFGSDGASVMLGVHNSVASRYIADLPGIFVTRCVCHSAHLCASEACKALPSECKELAHGVFNIFSISAKRTAELKEFQDFMKVKPHKLLHPFQTRWLSLVAVVQRLLEQWDALTLFFTDMYLSEGLIQGRQILEWLRNPILK